MATPPDFVAGSVLTAAQMNAIGAWEIASATATSGSTITVSNCFNTDYESYLVVISDFRTAVQAGLAMTFGSTTTGYWYSGLILPFAAGPTLTTDGAQNGASADIGIIGSTTSSGGAFFIHNPFLARQTCWSSVGTDSRTSATPANNGSLRLYQGALNNTTSYTAFTLTTSSTFSNINLRVYGFRK